MKICPKCDAYNDDNTIQCKYCGNILTEADVEKHRKHIAETMKKNEEKRRLKMRVHYIALIILVPVYILLYLMVIKKTRSFALASIGVFFPVLSYVFIHHPRAVFIFGHSTIINNVEDVELSDWYIFSCKVGGYIFAIFIFCFIIYAALSS